jgi:hypothetical protein
LQFAELLAIKVFSDKISPVRMEYKDSGLSADTSLLEIVSDSPVGEPSAGRPEDSPGKTPPTAEGTTTTTELVSRSRQAIYQFQFGMGDSGTGKSPVAKI